MPGTRWSRRTPTRRLGPGRSSSSTPAQVVGAVETLDHDAFDAKIVAPHLLDQLGVVHAFDQDARAGARRGRCAPTTARLPDAVRVVAETRACARCAGRASPRRRHDEPDRGAVDRERAGLVGKPANEPGVAAEHDVGTVELDQLAGEPRWRGAAREGRAARGSAG